MPTRALVTGGSKGIGRAIVERLCEDGYEVINLDLQPPASILSNEQHYKVDVSDQASLVSCLQTVLKSGYVTRLVNNAAIVRPGSVEHVSCDDLHAVMRVNLDASVACAKALIPGMQALGGGRIVNISSRAALGKSARIAYASSKAALHGFSKALALEVAAHNITVNAVGPGPIATELFEQVNPPGAPATQKILETIPMKRMGQPGEVAHLVASLLDEKAGFTTGQVIYVCGGMTVGLAT
ncbi:MAG: SDR family oxidoreductase [Comamonas sp.]